MIRAAFGFPVGRHHVLKPASGHNILFVRREDYVAHPRHGGKVESRLSNEQEVFDSLKNWASNYLECKINLVNGLFAHMSMKEQVRAIQDASVIIGAHGAGLTHIISARPKTVILEIISSLYRRPHFALISQWKGLEYHAINLDGSYADPRVVIDQLNSIVKSLGCWKFYGFFRKWIHPSLLGSTRTKRSPPHVLYLSFWSLLFGVPYSLFVQFWLFPLLPFCSVQMDISLKKRNYSFFNGDFYHSKGLLQLMIHWRRVAKT